jgi:hypothetical protein
VFGTDISPDELSQTVAQDGIDTKAADLCGRAAAGSAASKPAPKARSQFWSTPHAAVGGQKHRLLAEVWTMT